MTIDKRLATYSVFIRASLRQIRRGISVTAILSVPIYFSFASVAFAQNDFPPLELASNEASSVAAAIQALQEEELAQTIRLIPVESLALNEPPKAVSAKTQTPPASPEQTSEPHAESMPKETSAKTTTATVPPIQTAEEQQTTQDLVKPPILKEPPPEAPKKTLPIKKDATVAQQPPPLEKPTPSWQAGFIRKLAGGDGSMSLDIDSDIHSKEAVDLLHIDEAVALALKNNHELKAAVAGLSSSKWDKVGAYSEYLPSVELTLAIGDERSRPASYNSAGGDRVTDDTHLRRDRNITVRQPIIDLGLVADAISNTDKESVTRQGLQDVQNTVASDTVNVFLRLVQARIGIRLADEYKSYLENLAGRMRARVEGGGAAPADLDRILSRSSLAESVRLEAVGEYDTSLAEFTRLTGVKPNHLGIPKILAPDIPEDIESALNTAAQNNPQYLASLSKIDVAVGDRNKALTGILPKLSAQYSGSYSYDAGGSAKGNPVDGVYPSQRTDSMMLVAQWTLSGGTSIAGTLSGMAKKEQMLMQSIDTREKIEQSIRAGYTAVGATQKRLSVLQKTVAANERVVKGFEEQYQNGTRPLFDVLDAYEQLYNSRLNLMRVIFAYTQASYQLQKSMGKIVPSIRDVGKK